MKESALNPKAPRTFFKWKKVHKMEELTQMKENAQGAFALSNVQRVIWGLIKPKKSLN